MIRVTAENTVYNVYENYLIWHQLFWTPLKEWVHDYELIE